MRSSYVVCAFVLQALATPDEPIAPLSVLGAAFISCSIVLVLCNKGRRKAATAARTAVAEAAPAEPATACADQWDERHNGAATSATSDEGGSRGAAANGGAELVQHCGERADDHFRPTQKLY